ncbi:MAG: hypothetical protein ABIZ04_23790 [Opitutus sp.]
MYPAAELNALARRKALLRARISLDRLRCTALAAEVARPIDWVDRALVQWRRISPFAKLAALPLGILLQRGILPGRKLGLLGRGVRLLPVVLSAFKLFRAHARSSDVR